MTDSSILLLLEFLLSRGKLYLELDPTITKLAIEH